MRFTIISIFPEFFSSPLECGLLGKAMERELLQVGFLNPRDFAADNYRSIDDRPYGGGPGMVMTLDPLVQAVRSIPDPGRIILLTPRGEVFDQQKARELAKEETLTFICGRYEGVDARLHQVLPVESLSVGDFVLNGGESALLCVMESIARLLPGFMGKDASAAEESFSSGLLEYPHYTRPEKFEGHAVPEVLLSGNHAVIDQWRRRKALHSTLTRRPDLLNRYPLTPDDRNILKEKPVERAGRNLYLALVHHPVVNKKGEVGTVSLTNLDIHDIARVSRSYCLGGFFLVTPLQDQQNLARKVISHWTEGGGADANPLRSDALKRVQVVDAWEDALQSVISMCGQVPRVVCTSARNQGQLDFAQVRSWLDREPVLLLFGTGSGLAKEVLSRCDGTLRPVRILDDYNHLSVRSAASIIVDRILGDFA